MAVSTIAKALPFSFPRHLTHLLLVLKDRIHGSPKLLYQIYAQLLLTNVFHHPSPSICMCIDLFVHNLLVCMSFCFVMVRCVRKVFDEMFE